MDNMKSDPSPCSCEIEFFILYQEVLFDFAIAPTLEGSRGLTDAASTGAY